MVLLKNDTTICIRICRYLGTGFRICIHIQGYSCSVKYLHQHLQISGNWHLHTYLHPKIFLHCQIFASTFADIWKLAFAYVSTSKDILALSFIYVFTSVELHMRYLHMNPRICICGYMNFEIRSTSSTLSYLVQYQCLKPLINMIMFIIFELYLKNDCKFWKF